MVVRGKHNKCGAVEPRTLRMRIVAVKLRRKLAVKQGDGRCLGLWLGFPGHRLEMLLICSAETRPEG